MNLLKLSLAVGLVATMLTSSSFATSAYQDYHEAVYAPAATGGGSSGYNKSNVNPDR